MSTVTLKWTVPTRGTAADGSSVPLTPDQIKGASIFDSLSATPADPIGTVTGAVGEFTTGVLVPGDHVFTMTTQNTQDGSSPVSNPAPITITMVVPVPATVTDLTATINP